MWNFFLQHNINVHVLPSIFPGNLNKKMGQRIPQRSHSIKTFSYVHIGQQNTSQTKESSSRIRHTSQVVPKMATTIPKLLSEYQSHYFRYDRYDRFLIFPLQLAGKKRATTPVRGGLSFGRTFWMKFSKQNCRWSLIVINVGGEVSPDLELVACTRLWSTL